MSTTLLPRYVVARETPDGFEPATYPDGEPVYRVGLAEERVREAAVRDAEWLACADPEARFVVLDPTGRPFHRTAPVVPCPF